MALNGIVLGDAIKAAIDTAVASSREANEAQRTAVWRAIGNAIVAHITGSGTVVVTSVSGVTTGVGVSGPGTGTIV